MIISIQKAIELIPSLIHQAEVEIRGEGNGAQRRAWVIESLNSVIDIPFVPESAEAAIIDLLISVIIGSFNKLFGKNWLEKVELAQPVEIS